jgi:type II secretory pathway pseudopilin PulG
MFVSMSGIRQDQAGFTIAELLVTLIVGGLFVGSLALILNTHVSISARGRDIAVTNSYAENKIESLRSAGFLTLTDGTFDVTTELPGELKAPRSGTLVVSTEAADIKQVDLTVIYNDQGNPKTYSYTTFIGELGVGQY